jgi:hypothetical protein
MVESSIKKCVREAASRGPWETSGASDELFRVCLNG